jgi:hypothetical protein
MSCPRPDAAHHTKERHVDAAQPHPTFVAVPAPIPLYVSRLKSSVATRAEAPIEI